MPRVSHVEEHHVCSVKGVAEAVPFSVTCSPAHPGADHHLAEGVQQGLGEPGATCTGVMLPRGGGLVSFLTRHAHGDILGGL